MDRTTLDNPALRGLQPEKAVVFADLSGSTRLYEMLGDSAAKELITRSLERLVATVTEHDGRVVKTIGDEILAVFNTAHDAVLAARRMVREARDNQDVIPNGSRRLMQLRVGMHYGPVIEDAGDVFGDAVNTAARIVALAKSNTVMVSAALRKALPHALQGLVEFYDSAVTRGKARPIDVYQVLTDAKDHEKTTDLAGAMELTAEFSMRALALKADGITQEISSSRPTLTIGRGAENDLVCTSSMASREHARIQERQVLPHRLQQ